MNFTSYNVLVSEIPPKLVLFRVPSRDALTLRGVSFGKSNSIDNGPFDYSSPSCFEGDDIHEDGSDDNVFETSNRDKNGGLNNDVLLCSVSAIQSPKYYK